MPMMLKDGTGSGRMAKVDEHNFLMTAAVQIEHAFHHAKFHANLFGWASKHTIQAANTEEIVCAFTYTGTHYFVISEMTLSTDEPNGSTSAEFYMGSTGVAGGIAVAPFNMNMASQRTLASSILGTNNGASPLSFSSLGMGFYHHIQKQQGTLNKHTGHTLLLAAGHTVLVVAKTATVGSKLSLSMIGFEEGD